MARPPHSRCDTNSVCDAAMSCDDAHWRRGATTTASPLSVAPPQPQAPGGVSRRSDKPRRAGSMAASPLLLLVLLALQLSCGTATAERLHAADVVSAAAARDMGRRLPATNHSAFAEPETDAERSARRRRMAERREKAREWLKEHGAKRMAAVSPQPQQLQALSADDVRMLRQRNLSWFSGGSSSTMMHSASHLADPGQDYDKWAQAYRMLGGYIDCDHAKDGDSHDRDQNGGGGGGGGACSRWMLWAAYVNPNYQGGEYDEYFGDNPGSPLDCHNPDTEWILLGVYRQEFYQFIEQISKHLWAIDEYEYVVALAGLAYMTDEDCRQVGYDNNGNALYAGVMPTAYGKFQMGLYKDETCITPDTNSGKTYDDFGMQSGIDLGSKDGADDDASYSWAYDWWYDAQEYTLTNLNDIYEEFKYCTTCIDYPTYQDGYFIGDSGTDDEDLINQCWKFYSHDSFTCEAECISLAHAQGTILQVKYGDTTFGKTVSGFYQKTVASGSSSYSSTPQESAIQRLLANLALTTSFLLFVATFLAFAVARRSRYRESSSSKSRRLLDGDGADGTGRRSSRKSSSSGGDGLFRSARSKSASERRSSSRSNSKGVSSSGKRDGEYRPPRQASPRAKSAGRGQDYY